MLQAGELRLIRSPRRASRGRRDQFVTGSRARNGAFGAKMSIPMDLIRPAAQEPPDVLSAPSDRTENLIILSDVHLGGDLVDHPHPAGGRRRSRRVDDDLVALLDHYRQVAQVGERWRLVIAGDFIDFIGMAVRVGDVQLETSPTDEEVAHGLGNAADHARAKLRRVVRRHRPVFAALAAFVATGHHLTFVHGNHDLEFHWETVQSELRSVLVSLAGEQAPGSMLDVTAFEARIGFHPWFFHVDGTVYVEHGHQYDALCASDHVMAPLSPGDPRRLARGFCDVLLRFVVRPTPGMEEQGHEALGIFDYLAFGARLGPRGMIALAGRFFRAIVEMFRLRRAHASSAARGLRTRHEQLVATLAQTSRLGGDRLRALLALQIPPVTRSARGILAGVLVDRLAVLVASVLTLLVVGVLSLRHPRLWWAELSVALAWALAWRTLTLGRRLDPSSMLLERAGHIATLFSAPFVVMGHTHRPIRAAVAAGAATYVNLGSWDEGEPSGPGQAESTPASRTYLVMRRENSNPVTAQLLAWGGAASGSPGLAMGAWNPAERAACPSTSLA